MPMCTWGIFTIIPPLAVWYGAKLRRRWKERNAILRVLVKANVSGYERRRNIGLYGPTLNQGAERQ